MRRALALGLLLAGCGDAPPLGASIGPIALAAGQETTVCIEVPLANAAPLLITRIVADLAPGSHHLILYRSSATQAQPTPMPCTPFADIIGGAEVPLMIVEREHDELDWPAGVGARVEAHQMVRLEAHYLNATMQAIEGHGALTIEGVAPGPGVIESDFAFWGTTSISVPAQSTATTPVKFQAGIDGTHGFALTTHQHHMGTDFKVWSSAQAGDTAAAPIADTTDWASPPLYRLTPELAFDGTSGLSYQCEWMNTSDQVVHYGESALDEMCFLWMYYYPAHGVDVCIDGNCFGRM